MSKHAMDDAAFNQLLDEINQETSNLNKKVEILYCSRGFFSAEQASKILYAYGRPADKVRAIRIIEPRLCRTTCQDARNIIGAVSVHNDKLLVLDSIKRVLSDNQTKMGEEYILSAFPFEHDKVQALNILRTVGSSVADKVAAGGHQGYAALGGLYTQARPMVPHLYGPLELQAQQIPGYGKIEIPPEAQPGLVPSMYTGHPSYTYPPDKSYADDRGYPGHANLLQAADTTHSYPAGAPPLGHHSGAPYSVGFS